MPLYNLIPGLQHKNIFRPFGFNKTGFNLIIFRFDIRGKLSIIRQCDKLLQHI